ncbi:toprim domain-containing protein, partial [Acetobacter sp.]|uniref:toprim domain-containing protein n=1 Tax=Acetobacter sp. TaxID=440 RepID=UPI0039E9806D
MTYSASKRHFISPSQKAEIRAAIARDPERLAERYIPAGLVRLGRRGRETEWNVSRKKRGGGNGRFRIRHDGDAPLFSDFTHSPALAGRGVNFIAKAEGLPTGEIWRAYQIAAEIYGIETGLEAEAAIPAHIREAKQAQIEADRKASQAAQKAAEQLEREAHAAAADAARAILDASQPATSHPYTDRKAISCVGLFVATRTIRARLYSPTKGEWLPQAVAANKGDLIVPVYDAAGSLINAQKITADGTKRPIEGGPMRGAVHIIPGIEPGFIVEGYATGATIHQATGRMVAVAFNAGGLPVVAPLLAGRITAVAADNDQSETGRKEAEKTGLPFFMPPDVGTDWNDCAASRGLDYVRDALALPEPPKPLPPVTEAREELRQTVREWRSEGWQESPVMVIPADVGIGKTAAAITETLRVRESDTSAAPVVFAFTSHDLATEKADAIRSEFPDLTVRVWKGRRHTVEGRPMCENIKTAEIYQKAKKSVTKELCHKRGKCPYRDACPYLKQAGSKADVWIVTHATLQSGRPPEAIGTPSVLVVDESFFSGLKFRDKTLHRAASLRWTAPQWAGWMNRGEGEEVQGRCSRIAAMLEQAEGDYLTDADLKPAYLFTEHKTGNLTPFLSDEAKTALKQTEDFIQKVQQAAQDDVEKIKEITPIVIALTKVCAIIREVVERLQAGHSEMPRISLCTDEGERKFRLSGVKKIHEAWLAKTVGEEKQPIPALFLDATAEPEIIHLAVPDAKIMPQAKAATPHARHVWIKGNAWGFRRVKEAVEAHRSGATGRRDAQTINGLRDQVWRRWLEAGCPAYDGKSPTGLVVVPKVVEDYVSEAFPDFLPPGFGFLHHGNVAGFNSFERVRVLLVFGRNLQSTDAYESDAVSLTGQWPSPRVQAESYSDAQGVERESNPLPKETVRRTLPDGRVAS